MRPPSAAALLAWSALVGNAAAQVFTKCNPMNETCDPNPAFGTEANFYFNRTPDFNIWEVEKPPVTWDQNNGAGFKVSRQGESPTIRSMFYFFWGRTEVHMKAAKGTGVISSIMMLSDTEDEIDWEFFGSNETIAQSNFFGKGKFPEAGYHEVPGGVQVDYHNYTTDWTKDYLDFYIDGAKVRRLVPGDVQDGKYYPQTPMRLSIGIWCGGDPTMPEGTREWAGGDTDYSQAPFEMLVRSAHVTDYSSGKEYSYTDKSGSWESIKIHEGNSTVKEIINAPPEKSLSEKWNDLPSGAKIGVYAGAAGFVGLLAVCGIFYCIRQRRRGAREARAAEARAEAERLELERFRKAGVDPDSFASHGHEYNPKEMRRDGTVDQDSYSIPGSPAPDATTPASPLDHIGSAGVGAGVGAAAAASAMRSPMSPRHNDAQSHRGPGSPPLGPDGFVTGGMYSDRPDNNRSPGPQQGMMSPTQQYAQPNRSYTSPPDAHLRMGSPGPQQLAHPQPQRSFTADGYAKVGQSDAGFGHEMGQGYGNGNGGGYGNGQGGGGSGNQGAYWGNGGGGGYGR